MRNPTKRIDSSLTPSINFKLIIRKKKLWTIHEWLLFEVKNVINKVTESSFFGKVNIGQFCNTKEYF